MSPLAYLLVGFGLGLVAGIIRGNSESHRKLLDAMDKVHLATIHLRDTYHTLCIEKGERPLLDAHVEGREKAIRQLKNFLT